MPICSGFVLGFWKGGWHEGREGALSGRWGRNETGKVSRRLLRPGQPAREAPWGPSCRWIGGNVILVSGGPPHAVNSGDPWSLLPRVDTRLGNPLFLY